MEASSVVPVNRWSHVPAIVLAGGQGSRLYELTAHECKPALMFAGAHRIIDFALSNIRNSHLANAIVATQYCPETLHDHLAKQWVPEFRRFGGSLTVRHSRQMAYTGTANAVLRNLAQIDSLMPDHVLVLAADHVYQMDYRAMLAEHVSSGADVTISGHVVPLRDGGQFGVMTVDARGCITGFAEKPRHPRALADMPDQCLASMGIYVFKWSVLRRALRLDAADPASSHDFGKDVLPRLITQGRAQCHRFRSPLGGRHKAYWRDVGTLDSYLVANLEVMRNPSLLDFGVWPIATGVEEAEHGLRRRQKSFISSDAVINERAVVQNSVVLPGAVIGRRVRLTNTIVVPGTHIPDDAVVGPESPGCSKWFRRTLGGTYLVSQNMVDNLVAAAAAMRLAPHRPAHAQG
jgi:glucose-1-phosphate adenylyltransferase